MRNMLYNLCAEMRIKMSFVPYVIEQNSRGERSYDIYSRLLKDRIIFLGEEVTDVSPDLISFICLIKCIYFKLKKKNSQYLA